MFTGIVIATGSVLRTEPRGGDLRLQINTGEFALTDVAVGDSISVNGVCLTAVAVSAREFAADVSLETLAHTTLGEMRVGSRVNLELALALGARLGGHLVSGHVDGVGHLRMRTAAARSQRLRFEVPASLARYIAAKGSICIDGVSLTVNTVDGAQFEVNVVPHTLTTTALGDCVVGSRVNLEVDLIARYLERLLSGGVNAGGEVAADDVSLSADYLRAHGFLK